LLAVACLSTLELSCPAGSAATTVTEVAAGESHSLFVKSDGSLWVMGDNSNGELGDNSTDDRDSPEQVGVNVAAIAAGFNFSLFIETDGSLWAMGANDFGQLGDGTTTARLLPVLIVSSNAVAIAAGTYHSFFIKSDGSLWAMGYNANGQLGDGTYADRHAPVQVVPLVIPQPAITNLSLAGKNLVLKGANGESGRTCYTLMSANLTQPLNLWTPVATNLLTTDGAFAITATNAVNPTAAQRFYVLQVQ
jgi:alpha-tubulin suppressor-like RCC1 family protein